MNNARLPEDLLVRIDELVAISCRLPDSTDFWELRLYVDFELVLLFRLVSDLLGTHEPDPRT